METEPLGSAGTDHGGNARTLALNQESIGSNIFDCYMLGGVTTVSLNRRS